MLSRAGPRQGLCRHVLNTRSQGGRTRVGWRRCGLLCRVVACVCQRLWLAVLTLRLHSSGCPTRLRFAAVSQTKCSSRTGS